MGGSSVELIGYEKRFSVVLHGEEFIYEEKHDLEQDWHEINVYRTDNDGNLTPVEDISLRERIKELVQEYDQHISI